MSEKYASGTSVSLIGKYTKTFYDAVAAEIEIGWDMAFDRITVAVPDLEQAMSDYRLLLGCEPATDVVSRGQPAAWFGLGNTVIELVQQKLSRALVQALVLEGDSAGPGDLRVDNGLGLDLYQCDGLKTAALTRKQPGCVSGDLRVDHLVLRSCDAQACIDLFAGKLGIRLALDRVVPQWGGRMLFFRAGKLTLEVIESARDGEFGNYFWGLAYQCQDISATTGRLQTNGVEVSPVREGRKPGTWVATLKSHCLGIPTLLIEPVK